MGLASEAAVCNVALLRAGQRQLLDSLAEGTTEAQACAALYPLARDAVLEMAPWRFATKTAVLALTAENVTGWAYVYALPSDCVVPRTLWSGVRLPASDGVVPFEERLSGSGASMVLCTDLALAELEYTAQAPHPAMWPASFTEAVAWQLAVDLAASLPVKPEVAARCAQMAAVALAKAQAVDASKAKPDAQPEAEHIRARS